MMRSLNQQQINTWFDLGLFLDRLKEAEPQISVDNNYYDYREKLVKGGIGFLSFYYFIDGITIELSKYIKSIRQMLPGVPVHLIAGGITPQSDNILSQDYQQCVIPEIKSFDSWELYHKFFKTKLERGSKEYNELIKKYWRETLELTRLLGECIEKNNINLLFILNVCSNPGNLSLSLSTVLVSEYMGIPVINNNHDFYWEGGNRKIDIETKHLKPGPRDFFFINSDVGELFSLLEVLLPWRSRSWMSVNINKNQSRHIIEINGHNPANVALIGTAIDANQFAPISKRESINAMKQIGYLVGNRSESITDILKSAIKIEKPVLLGNKKIERLEFMTDNILFLQPTRIISRKKIETNFKLIKKLFVNHQFIGKFNENPRLRLSLIISGPIANGQGEYFDFLLKKFADLLNSLPEKFKDKVFIGFLFSEFDKIEFKRKFKKPLTIADLYNASSLILLPSENEGRGLPLIEAAYAGKPVFCRRYEPQQVYAEVIGEHLDESLRLKVLEFKDKISDKLVHRIVQRIFYPHDALDTVIHNRSVIKRRFNIDGLQKTFEEIFYKQFLQLKSIKRSYEKTARYFTEYKQTFCCDDNELNKVINTKTREYLPGYGRLGFMLYLKSLIDPSFFRVEEQNIRGDAHYYAQNIIRANTKKKKLNIEVYHEFFNAVDDIFNYSKGEIEIRHDHSFAYRHRNKKYYPYHDYTFQELTGLINIIFDYIVSPERQSLKQLPNHFFFADWNLALVQLTNSHRLGIDNRKRLFRKLKENVPRIYFPGSYIRYEMEFFILQPIRAILGLEIDEELSEQLLVKNIKNIPEVFIYVPEYHLYNRHSSKDIQYYLENTPDMELRSLYFHGVVKLIKIQQYCIGFHAGQLGTKGLDIIQYVKKRKGFLITNGQSAAMMTDILDIDRFHIGKVKRIITSKIMGIPMNRGFIQFVPAGIRTTLSYPTPIQTAKDFDRALRSKRFKSIAKQIGEEELFRRMREDAQSKGTPVNLFLKNLEAELSGKKKKREVDYSYVGGIYSDKRPWNGVLVRVVVKNDKENWFFSIHTTKDKPKPVTEQMMEFYTESGKKPKIAWNGGYILNPELVGKLGLPETYIGSPLGLLIKNNKILCPPLFNKPALLVLNDSSLRIESVNIATGFTVFSGNHKISFTSEYYNRSDEKNPSYYDLFHNHEEINSKGQIVVRLAGNVVKEIIQSKKNDKIKIIPVGLTLLIPKAQFSDKLFRIDKALQIRLNSSAAIDWNDVQYAVEAGPLLVDNGQTAINMKKEGWKTVHSINTQAARLDFTDMRGPKIAAGLTKKGELLILAVNGRIRESVGATHHDMAEILISYGAVKAMGFDPGGSSTLVVNGKPLNISPYNKEYERDIYSLEPQPRFVSNSIMGWPEYKR